MSVDGNLSLQNWSKQTNASEPERGVIKTTKNFNSISYWFVYTVTIPIVSGSIHPEMWLMKTQGVERNQYASITTQCQRFSWVLNNDFITKTLTADEIYLDTPWIFIYSFIFFFLSSLYFSVMMCNRRLLVLEDFPLISCFSYDYISTWPKRFIVITVSSLFHKLRVQ